MPYHAADDPDVVQPWFLWKRTWIIAGAILCLLMAGVGIFTYLGLRKIPEISGDVTIEADPNTRIYIGDKLVGTTNVTFTWAELFGDEKHQPLAVEMPSRVDSVTAETISGPGAKLLLSEGSSRAGVREAAYSSQKYLIRRADSALDHVFVIIVDCQVDRPRRYVVPIRLRKGNPSVTYFLEGGSSSAMSSRPGFMKVFGRSPAEIKIGRNFSPGSPPGQFAEEIKTKGLWEPGAKK